MTPNRAMLIAARSSQDFDYCLRATASARSKYASPFAAFGSGDSSAISPAMRWTSASGHLSLVFSIAVIASPMQRRASSNWPSSAWALAKYDKYNGVHNVDHTPWRSLSGTFRFAAGLRTGNFQLLPLASPPVQLRNAPAASAEDRPTSDRASATFATSTPCLSGRVHGGKKNAPDDSGAITFSGTFSGTLVGVRSGAGAGAGVWAGFGTVSGMSIGVEPG
jgi:hypothetical protein